MDSTKRLWPAVSHPIQISRISPTRRLTEICSNTSITSRLSRRMRTCATESHRKCQSREVHRIQKATAISRRAAWALDWAVTAPLTVVVPAVATCPSIETLTNKVVEIFTTIFQTAIKLWIVLSRRTDQIVSSLFICFAELQMILCFDCFFICKFHSFWLYFCDSHL